MAQAPLSRFCVNHPDRAGKALCMSCHKVVCHECATQWEGINYCVACLKKKRETSREKGNLWSWVAVLLICVVLFLIAVPIMTWSVAVLAEIF